MILKNHESAPVRKEGLSPTSKTSRKASGNKFVEEGGMSERVESLSEVDRRKYPPRARLGFVKFVGNGLRNKLNLIKSKLFRAETGFLG